MARAVRIALWHANDLKQRLQELEVFLNIQKIDICLISETHYTKHSYLKMRGFKAYHSPHPNDSAKGESAILVKDTIKKNKNSQLTGYRPQLLKIYLEGQGYIRCLHVF